jgi:alkylation response protein AidB-like acyl-CoA dehydrogenase
MPRLFVKTALLDSSACRARLVLPAGGIGISAWVLDSAAETADTRNRKAGRVITDFIFIVFVIFMETAELRKIII